MFNFDEKTPQSNPKKLSKSQQGLGDWRIAFTRFYLAASTPSSPSHITLLAAPTTTLNREFNTS